MERMATGTTVVDVRVVLFAGEGSVVPLLTEAVLVMLPMLCGNTRNVTVAWDPDPRVPKLPIIGLPLVANVPWLVEASAKLTDAGKVLVSITAVAPNGPLFTTTMV